MQGIQRKASIAALIFLVALTGCLGKKVRERVLRPALVKAFEALEEPIITAISGMEGNAGASENAAVAVVEFKAKLEAGRASHHDLVMLWKHLKPLAIEGAKQMATSESLLERIRLFDISIMILE